MNREIIVQILVKYQNQEISREELLTVLQEEGVSSYNISLNDLTLKFIDEEAEIEEAVSLIPKPLISENNLVVDLMKKAGVDNYEVSIKSGDVRYYDETGELVSGVRKD